MGGVKPVSVVVTTPSAWQGGVETTAETVWPLDARAAILQQRRVNSFFMSPILGPVILTPTDLNMLEISENIFFENYIKLARIHIDMTIFPSKINNHIILYMGVINIPIMTKPNGFNRLSLGRIFKKCRGCGSDGCSIF